MNKYWCFIFALISLFGATAFVFKSYDNGYVSFSVYTDKANLTYRVIKLNRKDNRVKIKYFATRDFDGTSVPKRFTVWSKGKNVISVCSGTYMQSYKPNAVPVGLTIDQGRIINNRVSDSMDAIVIVYSTGTIEVNNIEDGNLGLNGKKYNLKNSMDKIEFTNWAQKAEATIFQTHLLAFKNELKLYNNSSQTMRERRFLTGCKDKKGNSFNYIIHISNKVTLLNGTRSAITYLKEQEMMKNVEFVINLDTGYQDFLKAYDSEGNLKTEFQGQIDISKCVNLLSFYFE